MSKHPALIALVGFSFIWLYAGNELKGQLQAEPIGSELNPTRVSGGVMAGHILTKAAPVAPQVALKDHVSGATVLAIVVNPAGWVVHSSVISGPELLRASTLNAVNQWTYKPFLLNGQPVFVQTTVTITMTFGAGP